MMDTSCIILTPTCSQQQGGGEDEEKQWRRKRKGSWQVLFLSESRGGNWLLSRVPQEQSSAHREEEGWVEREGSTTHLFVSLSPSPSLSVTLEVCKTGGEVSFFLLCNEWVFLCLSYCVSFVPLAQPYSSLDSCFRLQNVGFVLYVFYCW